MEVKILGVFAFRCEINTEIISLYTFELRKTARQYLIVGELISQKKTKKLRTARFILNLNLEFTQ